MKSATTIECACHVGAVLAAVNQESIDLFTIFGHNLGIASQIGNDIQGIVNGSDIAKHKITLPVIYALAHTEGEVHTQLELSFSELCESTFDREQVRDLLFEIGAIYHSMM
jgi:octaprenyl-diphosphate synthase